jgi:hypothetical protein
MILLLPKEKFEDYTKNLTLLLMLHHSNQTLDTIRPRELETKMKKFDMSLLF